MDRQTQMNGLIDSNDQIGGFGRLDRLDRLITVNTLDRLDGQIREDKIRKNTLDKLR